MNKTKIHDKEYIALSDEEWNRIEAVIHRITNNQESGKAKVGRPRTDPRPVTNAVLHHITTGAGLSNVGSLHASYPSTPTRRRFYDLLIDTGALESIFALLIDTRPKLEDQYRFYRQIRGPYKQQELMSRESVGGVSWGMNLAPLPWGRPAMIADEQD
jgi:transposase